LFYCMCTPFIYQCIKLIIIRVLRVPKRPQD
jgi:hypothetical protein